MGEDVLSALFGNNVTDGLLPRQSTVWHEVGWMASLLIIYGFRKMTMTPSGASFDVPPVGPQERKKAELLQCLLVC